MKNIFLLIISASLLYFIFKFLNIDVSQFEIFKFEMFLVVSTFSIISITINSLRLYLISKNYLKIKFKNFLLVSFVSFVLNVVSLSGTGEIVKYFLLSHKLKKKEDIVSTFLIERGYGFVSITFFFIFSISNFFLNIDITIIILFLLFMFLYFLNLNNFFLKKIPYLNYFNFSFYEIYKNINQLSIILISLIIHIIYILQLFIIICLIYKINIDLEVLFLLILIVLILNALPISYSGFGAREFSVVILGAIINLEELSLINSIISLGLYTYILAIVISIVLYVILKINYNLDLLGTLLSKKITLVRMK